MGGTGLKTERAQRRAQKRRKDLLGAGLIFVLLVGAAVYSAFSRGYISLDWGKAPVPEIPGGEAKGPENTTSVPPLEVALDVRGVYLTMDSAGSPSKMASTMKLLRGDEGLNALVIDVKDNNGRVPCKPPSPLSSPSAGYGHFPGLVSELKREGIFTIARIVAFQDPHLTKAMPEQAIRKSDGSLWKDRDGRLWLNPYDKRNWEYVKDLCLWALDMGFDEVQLDYVRFPDSAQNLETSGVLMPGYDEYSGRGDAIVSFLEYLGKFVEGKGYLSADIFGFTTIASDDMGIGQKLEDVASVVDFICPMVYPSHYYNAGIYGLDVPEAHPYEVVLKAMAEAKERTSGLRAKIRPWLQDFSFRIKYGPKEVQDQIQATFESEIDTFLLWNPSNVYTKGVTYKPPK